jgi:3-deoxy-manno-octulosonate cytidylyltransferase (CMP-KDO synthetase)
MIVWVYRRTRMAERVGRVIVATDDHRIADAVRAAGGEVCLTSASHRSGTERVAEVAQTLDSELIVNVQGDEPLIEPETIDAAIEPLLRCSSVNMTTTSEPLDDIADVFDPNVVKVTTDGEGFALYFSRQPIPYLRDAARRAGSLRAALEHDPSLLTLYRKHSGLYVYRRSLLLELAMWPPTPLEQAEQLEQLRALEHGIRIQVVRVAHRSQAVDTQDDLDRVREIVAREPDRWSLAFNPGEMPTAHSALFEERTDG